MGLELQPRDQESHALATEPARCPYSLSFLKSKLNSISNNQGQTHSGNLISLIFIMIFKRHVLNLKNYKTFLLKLRLYYFALLKLWRCLFLPLSVVKISNRHSFPLKLLIALKDSKNKLSVLKINMITFLEKMLPIQFSNY